VIISPEQIEEIEARLSELQAEVDSYADEGAENRTIISALEAEVKRLRARLG
jgi:chromosome segregation ATPase